MEKEDIIDFLDIEDKSSPTKSLILWWERKRLYYNLALFGVIIFVVYDLWAKVVVLGVETIAGYSIYFLLGANIFYTLGWISGLFVHFFYRHENWNHLGRWILYVVGTLFSIVWMLIVFSDAICFGFNW